MTLGRRQFCVAALGAAPAVFAEAPWPAQPLRLLVAYAPGGISDETARTLADLLAPRLGVPVRVEHRPGAGGVLAMDALARAEPDGHTLCFAAASTLTLAPLLTRTGFDPLRDIAPVIDVMHTPLIVVGTPAWPGATLAALLDDARQRPGALRWATSGTGTLGHLVWQLVCRSAAVEITHIPYKGGGPQLNDALGGQFEVLSTNVAPLQLHYVADGRFTPLAVGAPQRLPVLPGVPTLAEAGFAAANLSSVFGLFAPGRTPAGVVAKIHATVAAALREPVLQQRLQAANNLPAGRSTAAFEHFLRQQALDFRALKPAR
ncbi:tripartite tricarboxylate transporter substrate binding protein [Schlegelella sp. S2-27]|uniref:Tripartite tricarboxylate transporter substrate binding protein n=1 Tax=Caldimonas mangrovi TaxID=2944811 RepID=A0ABT0YUZ5_9BURK|nr:tripartite tricarboxylate transporter substrate binding protein [Caldimonas mangrovi]MCM5682229.1 tripartite tricarboxylate transporter substrate binding protein [Caldimonas mangrovi]